MTQEIQLSQVCPGPVFFPDAEVTVSFSRPKLDVSESQVHIYGQKRKTASDGSKTMSSQKMLSEEKKGKTVTFRTNAPAGP